MNPVSAVASAPAATVALRTSVPGTVTAGGAATVTLQVNQIGSHNHTVTASTTPLGTVAAPSATVGYSRAPSGNPYGASGTATAMSAAALATAGGGSPHNNLQPYRVLNYCIALQGIFPPRP